MLHIPSAVFYGIMSTMMVFGNKYALTNLNFNKPIFMILMEMVLNVSFMWVVNDSFAKEWRIDTSTVFHFLRQPSDYKYHYLVVIFYTLHSVLSLKALTGLNIPMYITFKRCTPIVNLLISIFIFKNMRLDTRHNQKLALSVLLITLGVIIAGIGDLDPDFKAYVYCALSVIFQAAYLSSIQKCGEEDAKNNRLGGGTSSLQTLYECSTFSTPILAFFFLLTGEYSGIWHSLEVNSLLTIMAVIFCGSLLCFSQFWCTLNNNAVTTSVVGVLKSIVQTIAGMLLFESISNFSSITLIGMTINLVSGCWYTYLKYMEKYSEPSMSKMTPRSIPTTMSP